MNPTFRNGVLKPTTRMNTINLGHWGNKFELDEIDLQVFEQMKDKEFESGRDFAKEYKRLQIELRGSY
jgi:hypothetical protein